MAGEKQEPEREGTHCRSGKATLGPERAGDGSLSRHRKADGRWHPVDDRFGKRLPCPAEGRHGCSATHARESQRGWKAQIQ